MKQIRTVAKERIEYIDVDGAPRFIDFETCYQNYWASRNDAQKAYETKFDKPGRKLKRVGQRDFGAKPPYIEFFTDPMTRFEFDSMEEFHKLAGQVRRAGWW